jgi:predicted esterase
LRCTASRSNTKSRTGDSPSSFSNVPQCSSIRHPKTLTGPAPFRSAESQHPDRLRAFLIFAVVSLLACEIVGCNSLGVRPTDPVQQLVDPELGRKYLLYRPAAYDAQKEWPLVVVCHGGLSGPRGRMTTWQEQADTSGFFVLAPTLDSSGARSRAAAEALRQDERHVLAALRHVRAGHSISEDRVFIHGHAGGALAALYTGLSHSDVFRAIALTQPKFSASPLGELRNRIDRHQPVYVHFNVIDHLTGNDGSNCVEWLRNSDVAVLVNPQGRAKGDDIRPAVQFFEETVRKTAWLHIRWFTTEESRKNSVKFRLQSSFTPTTYRWEFGDGRESPVAEPLHAYAVPGRYRVILTVTEPRGAVHRRAADVSIP